jgi:hypothetical protein
MKQIIRNVEEWLSRQSKVLGQPTFQYEGNLCTPVVPEVPAEDGPKPVGFLVRTDYEVSFVSPSPATPEHNLQWESMLMTYLIRITDADNSGLRLPSEYWYG